MKKTRRAAAFLLAAMISVLPLTGGVQASAAVAGDGPAAYGITEYIGSWEAAREAQEPKFQLAVQDAFTAMRAKGYNSGLNDAQKALMIHDWLITRSEYDYDNFKKGSMPLTDFLAYGPLVNGKAVCAGYASAYCLLMNAAGIPTVIVSSSSHAWNLVHIGGKWYHVDVTWDDPYVEGAGSYRSTGYLMHRYFLVSDSTVKSIGKDDHSSWELTGPDSGKLPAANSDAPFSEQIARHETNRPYGLLSALADVLPADAASVRLDTSRYSGTVGKKYMFAVDSSISEFAFASSSNPSCVSVSGPQYRSGRQFYTIYFQKAGSAQVSVITASGKTASFPVTVSKPAVWSDTTGSFRVKNGSTYQFMLISDEKPEFAVGSDCFSLVGTSHSGNRWFFKVRANGEQGQGCGFYLNRGAKPTAIGVIS